MGQTHRQCPNCSSKHVSRRRRKSLVDCALSWFGRYPYKCAECEAKFRSRREKAGAGTAPKGRWVTCPRCGGQRPNRIASHKVTRTMGNYVWRKVGIPGYRCPDCRKRFFSIRTLKTTKP